MKQTVKHPNEKDIFTVKRFQQLMWALLVLSIFNLLNIYLGDSETKLVSSITIITVVVIILFSFHLINIDKEDLARTMVLSALVLSILYMAWLHGGIGDTTMLSYPILVVYSILIGGVRAFLPVVCVLIVSILVMGANALYDWIPNPVRPVGWEQIFDAALITLIAAYGAWTFNADMCARLRDLNKENDKVVNSRETIKLMVERDALTGLDNRSACESHYKKLFNRLNRATEQAIVFFVDLDDFKNINDAFGHNAGDELLITISAELSTLLHPTDVACRLGGDEFVIIIRRAKTFDIDGFATDLLKTLTTPYVINNTTVRMTGSIGIATTSDPNERFDEIHTKSDIAMYQSKKSGKNTFSYYTPELHAETVRKTAMINGLKDAVANNLLDLHLQPKVNLSTGQINSAEALLRWNRSNPHNFNPGEFIPVIESTELIHEIGQWCLEEACRICRRWHDAGFVDMTIAVNVSSVQFMRSDFEGVVAQALQESRLPAEFLEIELTEHVLIQHNETIKAQLKSLKDLGISLSIDDFGTGYSNMSYLINFKVDSIKLDRSFISQINTSTDHYAVVKAMIQMAHILGLQVVAEGIESEQVRSALIDLDCDCAQGFLWSKALPESEYLAAVTRINNSPLFSSLPII